MSSPTPSSSSDHIRAGIAAAAERRSQAQIHADEVLHAKEHERRQEFRRLIDPGIFRPNSKETALASIQTLSTLAENLLREPDNPKFQKFKPTNHVIKQRLIDPKGALEYAVGLGFRAEVEDFQPFYVWNKRFMRDLRIGAEVLKEVLQHKTEQEDRIKQWKREEKAAAEAVQRNVKLAFMDDRKTKQILDKRERERQQAKAEAAARGSVSPPGSPNMQATSFDSLPGAGNTVGGRRSSTSSDRGLGSPPPYHSLSGDE
ncbi:hypothetical protein JAAARDRAFT_64380 [Jaapia argillacea MUCL 33604]|uniref:PUB domain-containing protein n=1 Tax=Jaapia argillacea MUCL 33604 TaxID=933084 RepID=A0A067QEE0_9AGAM|nr:hypothetical protein JAAARDRAFT_64380 [Jaapia argillacea MUCL 33604]